MDFRFTKSCQYALDRIFRLVYTINNLNISINKVCDTHTLFSLHGNRYDSNRYNPASNNSRYNIVYSVDSYVRNNEFFLKKDFYNVYKSFIFNECDISNLTIQLCNIANLIINSCYVSMTRSHHYSKGSHGKYFIEFDNSNIMHLKIINNDPDNISFRIRKGKQGYIHHKSIFNIVNGNIVSKKRNKKNRN